MNYVKINGMAFDVTVAISDYEESFTVQEGPNAGKSHDTGRVIRDIQGCFIGHTVTFFANSASQSDMEAFDALWDYLKYHSVDESVELEAADGQKTIAYEAYYTAGKRKLQKRTEEGLNIWTALTVQFIPVAPQIVPV